MKIGIYVEGGGGTSSQKAILRQGFDAFLRDIRNAAPTKVIMCGSRQFTFEAFKDACAQKQKGVVNILLVDSEGPVSATPVRHLKISDGWPIDFARDEQLQLMVQTMETWLVADPEALEKFYGQGFHIGSLPKTQDLESTPKEQIAQSLDRATAKTSKRGYEKITHASKLLAMVDAKKVRERCKHCERLFRDLEGIINHA